MATMTIHRTAQRAASLQEWWQAKSQRVSLLCGEEFTHGEVLLTALACLAFLVVFAIAGGSQEGGAL